MQVPVKNNLVRVNREVQPDIIVVILRAFHGRDILIEIKGPKRNIAKPHSVEISHVESHFFNAQAHPGQHRGLQPVTVKLAPLAADPERKTLVIQTIKRIRPFHTDHSRGETGKHHGSKGTVTPLRAELAKSENTGLRLRCKVKRVQAGM